MDTDIRVRRVYDEPSGQDGERVLVDRLWPRGMRAAATGRATCHARPGCRTRPCRRG
ncbi:MAG: DUF488 family protein, N3 subclade [Streptosporangiaceae bacterium]